MITIKSYTLNTLKKYFKDCSEFTLTWFISYAIINSLLLLFALSNNDQFVWRITIVPIVNWIWISWMFVYNVIIK